MSQIFIFVYLIGWFLGEKVAHRNASGEGEDLELAEEAHLLSVGAQELLFEVCNCRARDLILNYGKHSVRFIFQNCAQF